VRARWMQKLTLNARFDGVESLAAKRNPGFGGKSVFRNSISLNTVDPESQVWRGWIAAQRKKTAFNPGGGLVIIWDGARTNSYIRRTSSHAAFAGFANQFSGVCRESCASSLTRKSCFGAVSVVYSLFRCAENFTMQYSMYWIQCS